LTGKACGASCHTILCFTKIEVLFKTTFNSRQKRIKNNCAVSFPKIFKQNHILSRSPLSRILAQASGKSPKETKMHLHELKSKSPAELILMAEKLGIEDAASLRKQDILFTVLKKLAEDGQTITGEGVLEVLPDGFGFLRSPEANYLPGPTTSMSRRRRSANGLRTGDTVEGEIRAPKDGERYFALTKLTKVNFDDADNLAPHQFRQPDAALPEQEIEARISRTRRSRKITPASSRSSAPIGKGQRALIVAPPRTGKTVLLQNIANSITTNHPEVLSDRAADRRASRGSHRHAAQVKGEVISSTFDEPATRHVQVAEMVIEKAKRLVEHKRDVVILLDSITRLGRAYNTVVPSSGKVLTGGVDANALQRPKRFFGAARNIEEGGSLTIIATALIDTGSRMDEVIFEEFKGTGNSEIVLDRKVSDKRVFPAIDIQQVRHAQGRIAGRASRPVQDVGPAPHPEPDGHDRRDRIPARQAEARKDQRRFLRQTMNQ
jgi:transcription termination factor Rho